MRSDTDIQHIWFTSDLHLLHPKIIDICDRPTTIEEHDKWLIDRINEKVGKKDTLYILGDVSMGNKIDTEKLLDKIHGKKVLILGNHDNNIKTSTRFTEITQIKDFNFNSPSYPNIHIVLCHYPLMSWNRKVFGSMSLYGHVHGRQENQGLSFDIGVDANNWYPLNLEEVFDKMTKISLSFM
jgi:calcineurin-like phosphoesterase family protein